jgi:hypothetical protein
MKFGILKTAIENKMVNSFAKNELTENFKTFRKTILGNSKLKKLYFIYDKLNENLGVDQTTASIILEELSNEIKSIKLTESEITKIKKWVGNSLNENNYSDIDNYLHTTLSEIEKKSESKIKILENLQKTKKVISESKLPISSLLKIANNNANEFLKNLSEGDKKEVMSLLKESDTDIKEKFESLKTEATEKLNSIMNESTDENLKQTINETIKSIQNKKPSTVELIKLKELYNNILL